MFVYKSTYFLQSNSATMVLKLHGTAGSPPVFRVMAALFEKDLDFEFVPVDIFSREQKTPHFLALNPFGQLPVLEDGDFKLFESRAVTKYIADAYADKGTDLISKDPQKAAIQAVWMEVEAQKFHSPSIRLVFQLRFNVRRGLGTDEAVVEECEAKLAGVLDVYESRLTESKYLSGDCFTLADLNHLPELHYLMKTKVKKLFDARPHVNAWAADILSRPAWVKTASIYGSK